MAGGRSATDAVIQGRAAISVNDPGHPTPPEWVRVALTEVADLGTGHTPSRKHPEYWGGDVPWIGIRDAGAHHGGVIQDTAQHTNELGLANSAARLLPEGTVCLSRTASVGYVVMMGRPMATSQDFVTWTCSDAIDPHFLMQALLAEGDDIRRFGEGSTHTTIYFPEVKAFHIDLPPKAEQRRIAAKIDTLSAKSKRARERLNHVPRLVEKYKQAVLASVLGRHRSPLRTLDELTDRRATIRYGVLQPGSIKHEGVRLIRICDLDTGEVQWNEVRRIAPEIDAQYANARVLVGDILLSVVGTIGRTALVRKLDEPANIARAVARIRVDQSQIEPEWLMLRLRAVDCQQYFGLEAREVARKTLNIEQIKKLQIAVPEFGTQAEDLVSIRAAFAWIDRLAAEVTSARALIDGLDQAILAKAFRGELVPQDPADEPASVLLERIRAERAGAPATKRRGRPRAHTLP